MASLEHAINQASVRRLVGRFTYTPKRAPAKMAKVATSRSPTKTVKEKSLRIAKAALDTLNAIVANYAQYLYRRQDLFHMTLADVDRVRLEQTWLNKKLQLDEGIPAMMIRKQIEQHLTHALVAACNTTLDCGRATVTAQDLLRPLMLTRAILNVQSSSS